MTIRLFCKGILGVWLLAVAGLAAQAVEPLAPGLSDVVVYHPGAHERGLPAVVFEGMGPELQVDIPPAVHVHRYYYSGDKEIQGPIIQGGPTVIVANHPKNGTRMYVNVVLPAGAPQIAYNGNSITYVYPDQRVRVEFSNWRPDQVTVENLSGQGVARRVQDCRDRTRTALVKSLQRSPVAQTAKQAVVVTGQTTLGVKDAVGGAAAGAVKKAGQLTAVVPGVSAMRSYAADRPARLNIREIDHAAAVKERSEMPFVRTNR